MNLRVAVAIGGQDGRGRASATVVAPPSSSGEGASRPWLESFGKRSKVCTYLFLTGNTDPPVQLHRHVNQGPRVAIWSAHHGEGEPQQLTQHLLSLTDAQQPQGPPPSQTQRQQPVYSSSNLLSTPPSPVRRPTNQPTQRSHSINTIPSSQRRTEFSPNSQRQVHPIIPPSPPYSPL